MGNQDKVWGFLSQDNWKALIPNNNTSIIDGKNMWGHGDIIMMLCAESDPYCINPIQTRALTDEEYVKPHDKNFLQFTWGMDVTLKNLPVGKYNLMLFEDSKTSVAIGRDWQSPNPQCTQGKDWWNCRISEFDMALVSTADYNAQPQSKAWQTYSYPEPKTLPVTIQECSGSSCNEDLGTLYLSHYGDRNISEPYRPEDAYLAVATYWGVRIVDLATPDKPTVLSAPGGGYDYKLVDSDGSDLYDKNYRPCGIVDGGDGQTVWITLKYDQDSGKQLHPQIAVPFNVKTKQQIGNKHIILSHAIKGGTEYDINEGSTNICMGYVKDGNFFGLSRVYSFGNGDNASWISFASDISQVLSNTKNIESINSCLIYSSSGGDNCVPDGTGVVNRHPQYLKGVIDVAMWHDVVYTIKSATNTKGEHVVASDAQGRCSGSYNLCINKSKIINNEHFSDDKGVKVSKRLEDMNAQLDGGPYNEGTCMPDFGAEYGGPSITIVEKSANEAWLFASKCTMVKAWKLTWNGSSVSETPLAIDGQTNFDISEKYGQYIQSWALSPDGKTLFGAPSGRARANFGYKQGRNDAHKVTNRMMFLVLDVSGDAPKVSTAPQYNRNVDNYEGQISNNTGENLSTPAIDPGMELLPFSYYQYLNQFSDGLAGYIIFTPASAGMHSPMIAVGQNTLWYSQKGNKKFTWTTTPYGRSPVCALGPYRDIAAYDLDKAVMLYFPNSNTSGSERYFHPYAAGSNASKTTDRSTGFKLQPDTGESTVSMGIVYIKK